MTNFHIPAGNWRRLLLITAFLGLVLPGAGAQSAGTNQSAGTDRSAPPVQPAESDACLAFKWDLSHERALFGAASGTPLPGNASPPVTIPVDQAIDLALLPQSEVRLTSPPGKPSLTDGAFGGQARFTVASAGVYRIGIDGPFWIDVVGAGGGEPLTSIDFGGPRDCSSGPTKLVTYEFPAGEPLVLQLSGATNPRVRVSIVPVP